MSVATLAMGFEFSASLFPGVAEETTTAPRRRGRPITLLTRPIRVELPAPPAERPPEEDGERWDGLS